MEKMEKNESVSIIKNYIDKEQKISKFDIKSRVKNISETKINDILVEFDARYLHNNHFEFIKNLSQIIESSGEIGTFEYDIFKIEIKQILF